MSCVAIIGSGGVMGSILKQVIPTYDWISDVVGITPHPTQDNEVASLDHVQKPIDVIIDFSTPSALRATLTYAAQHHIPCLIATTGLNEEHHQLMKEASQHTVVFESANLSIGVALLNYLLSQALTTLGSDINIEVVETHHTLKKDAPSGTAKLLANTITSYTGQHMVTDSNHSEGVQANTFGVHSLRLGKVVGEHSVSLAFGSEIITLSHSALSKDIFAHGACRIAKSLLDLEYGHYTMSDILKENA